MTAPSDLTGISTRKEFGAALTRLREGAGLTVREVAGITGLSASTLGGYFSGRHVPPVRPPGQLQRILAACRVEDPDVVLQWQDVLAQVRRSPGPRPSIFTLASIEVRFDPASTDVSYKNTEQGAATSALLAGSPLVDGVTGRYFEDCAEAIPYTPGVRRGVAAWALDPDQAKRLWRVSLDMLAVGARLKL
jgi:transcriptional regulator with XRE-family HTH domain